MPVNDQQFFSGGRGEAGRPPYTPNDPPPWIISEQPGPAYPPPRGGGGGRLALILLAGLVVLLLAGGGAWYLVRRSGTPPAPPVAAPTMPGDVGDGLPDDNGGSGSGLAVTPTEEDTYTPPAELTPDAEQAAVEQLDELTQQDLARVSLNGQWVAQLASKYPGIYDKIQTTPSGSHTFQATDILQEHERLRQDPANGDVEVVLLNSTDFGIRQLYQGHPLYVTFGVGDFGTAQAVRDWCVNRFPDLSDTARANQ